MSSSDDHAPSRDTFTGNKTHAVRPCRVHAGQVEALTTSTENPVHTFFTSVRSVDFHVHAAPELLLVLQGTVALFNAGVQRQLGPGDIAMVRAREPHACQGLVEDNLVLCVQIDPWLMRHDPEFGRRFFDLSIRDEDDTIAGVVAQVRRLMALTMIETRMKRAGWRMEVESLTLRLLSLLLRQVPSTLTSEDPCALFPEDRQVLGGRLRAVADFIRQHAHEPLAIDDVARAHGLSVGYLSRLFKSEAGEGFHSFVTNLRLRRALEKMAQPGEQTITDIAFECGFPSSRSFNVAFARAFGCTPSTWRENQRKQAGQHLGGPAYGPHQESQAMRLLHSYIITEP